MTISQMVKEDNNKLEELQSKRNETIAHYRVASGSLADKLYNEIKNIESQIAMLSAMVATHGK